MIVEKVEKTAVERLFPNQGVHANAKFIAGLHDRAIDYLEQAPVLALSFGTKAATRADRLYVAMRIGGPIERGERLRNVMQAVGVAYPLRKIKPWCISPGIQSTIRNLGGIDGSTLSQAIPDRPKDQRDWLHGLRSFRNMMFLRSATITPDDWRWLALRSGVERAKDGFQDFADFRAAHPNLVIDKWTWERAQTEVTFWHDRLAAEKEVQDFGGGIRSDTCIDLSDWPDHFECKGFEFFKLSTPSMLMEEGRRMRHCVGSYVRDVLNGNTSIFSVRAGLRRVATMQLVGSRIVQIKGFANRTVSSDLMKAALAFCSVARLK